MSPSGLACIILTSFLGAVMVLSARRLAFSLVELLVVVAIIAILIGMSVPAVQKARESSARTQCQNNLKQLCLALHGYAFSRGHFPSAYTASDLNPGWGWGAALLPLIDQEPLHRAAVAGARPFGNGANPALPTSHTQTELAIFRCARDRGPGLNAIRLNHAMSNYRAVAGPITYSFFAANLDMGGVMYHNSKITVADIKDGLSNTLAIGECIYDEDAGKRAALWAGMTGVRDGAVWISDVMWWVDQDTAKINGPAPQAFSSRHHGGAFFGFCDGSVRFLAEGGNTDTIRWIAGRNDGKFVNLEF
jgi:prepilin-type N-terminal cleavage/methylation domain-containing protein